MGASLVQKLGPRWSGLGALQYYYNNSNLKTAYQYSRLAISVGANYSF